MADIVNPVRKVGRPATRLLARGRSNSVGNAQLIQVRPALVPVQPPPPPPPVQDVQDEEANDVPHDAAPAPALEGPAAPNVPEDPGIAPNEAHVEEDVPDPRQVELQRLRRQAQNVLVECQDFIEIHEGVQPNPTLVEHLKAESQVLLTTISGCEQAVDGFLDLVDVDRELKRWRRIIKTFVVSILGRYNVPAAAPPPAPVFHHIPQTSAHQRGKRDASPDTMDMIHRDLVFFMNKLHGDLLVDVGSGAEVSNSDLRDLHDITLPQINRAMDDCRRVLNTYMSHASYDRELAREVQQRCEDASTWASDLMFKHRSNKLHLDKNTKHREITFTVFKPGGDVCIYQFLSRFESWADGYLSEEAKADQLYHRYLDRTITEGYTELTSLQGNFKNMKDWLIKKYGSVVSMAHGYVKSITRLVTPRENDLSANAQYLRSIHRLLVNVSELEISRGVPVPKLQSYLGSNAFLSVLVDALPSHVQDKLFEELISSGIDDLDNIEGRAHLTSVIRIIKTRYQMLELKAKTSPVLSSTVQQPQQQQSQTGSNSNKKQNKSGNPAPNKTVNVTNAPAIQNPSSAPIPFLTGGNAVPINNARQNTAQPQTGHQNNQNSWNRWSCPIKNHRGHDINLCKEFWEMTPRDRREACKYAGCFTCLERNKSCRGGACSRFQEIPAELVCPDCAQSVQPGRSPVCVLMCGLNHHRKPSQTDLTMSLEAWIPDLNLSQLGSQLRVNLTDLGFHSSSLLPPPPRSKTGPPTLIPSNVVYDTTTGESRPITPDVLVNKTSRESAFYVMQTVKIKNEEVLIFYDDGSNGHLIEGNLAEVLKLDVVASESVPVGALGGKTMWSEFGSYSIVLGPDIYGECHELEMQGISTITNRFPEVELQELWDEANEALHGRRQMPIRIGGSRAHILIGIKSTQLGPKHKYSLPNGLGIYESVLYDVFQSNICFGGPHAVFTQAYRKAGVSANLVQVMFTEMARAYMDSPRTFIRVDVEDHGPPMDLAREIDMVEEISRAFPGTQKLQSRLSRDNSASDMDDGVVIDVEDCESVDAGPLENNDYNPLIHCEHVNCMKTAIPLSKLKGLQDELDIPEIVEFRCESCANCPTCKLSARAKTKSLQESFEQEVIEKSVHVSLDEAKVWVDLPFIKDPTDFLTSKHGGPDNYNQALRVYQAQCRKRDDVKDQVRKAQGELVDKGYMSKLSDLPSSIQCIISSASFCHYYPWRAVYKEDSVTTPVRLVVDPTMTGLNEILAKGVNMLSKIPEILLRFRCFKHTWNTDISKLYNQLHLNESSLPFSLFLFNHDLDLKVPPDVWVMSRAWYGVSCTGNQAGVAIEYLANHFRESLPAACGVLFSSRYVDDILSGADSNQEIQDQIQQTQECLKAGGFSLKYIALSGQKPPPKASVDGKTVGCLGLAWNTEADTLSLAFNESFFLKRVKGQKEMLDLDLSNFDSFNEVLAQNLVTRAGILSRVAGLYDPCGWWEPAKVQMKLAMQSLNGLEWTAPVPPENRKEWVVLFQLMNQLKDIHLRRAIIPVDAPEESHFRVIAVADAAEKVCGCAIYAGVQQENGTYACNLILAKSKMSHSTIPRNELEGVLLAAEASLLVQRALADKMESIRYYTDSRIVVCWVLNQSKRLRMWAYNRVQAIHTMIRRMEDGVEVIPLYHISGLENIADLLTKPRTIRPSDLQIDSEWQTGLKWMVLPTDMLPSDQFIHPSEDIAEDYNQEIFKEVDTFHVDEADYRSLLVSTSSPTVPDPEVAVHIQRVTVTLGTWIMLHFDFVKLGWLRAWNRLFIVIKACAVFKHGLHKGTASGDATCHLCTGEPSALKTETDHIIDQAASETVVLALYLQKVEKLFHFRNDVWYSKARLHKEGAVELQDLDCLPFFDHLHLKKLLPVIYVKTDLFHSFLSYIHLVEFPHMGVESTLRRIKERFYPVGNARGAIVKFRSRCSKCRLMLQKVVALELADFPSARTTVAPPFWSVQIDIAMSFKAKPTINSRKTFPCHALIIVCLLTSATNIHVLDGITTQAVVQSLERHSARYGVPGHLYVDSGTQLEKLQDASFQLRDIQKMLGNHRFCVTVATPKAHQQQGRVESKIKIMRKMLMSWSTSSEECNTLIGWETVFAKVASAIDDIPIARGSASASSDLGWEIITPNRLKLGRNNHRQLEGPIKLDNCPQSQLDRNRLLSARWYEIFIERLPLLVPPPAKEYGRLPEVDDVVLFLFTDPNFKKLWVWKLGVIEEKLSRSSFKIRYSGSGGDKKFVHRAVGQISIIVPVDQLHVNHPRFLV